MAMDDGVPGQGRGLLRRRMKSEVTKDFN